MAASAIVEVKDGGGSWVDTEDGVDVTASNVISIRLKTPGTATKWQLECFGTDEVTATAPSLTNVNPVDNEVTSPSTTVTFVMPAGSGIGRALVFRSVVDGGGPGLTTTFGVYVLTTDGDRVGAVGETREGSQDFGWAAKLNPLIRAGAGGPGSSDATSIQGFPVSTTDPTSRQVLIFDGSQYVPGALTTDDIAPAFAATLSGAQVVELGQSVVTPAFTASYTSGPPTSVLLNDSEATPTQNVSGTPTSFNSTGVFSKNVSGAGVTFTITAFKNTIQKQSSVAITWYPRVYYGAATPAAYTEAFIEALASSALAGSRGRSFSVNAGSGQKIYYAYPSAFGDGTFFVGGFEGGFVKAASSVAVTNAHGVSTNYDIWESTNSNLGSTTVTVT